MAQVVTSWWCGLFQLSRRGNIVRGFPRGGTHVLNTSSGLTSNVLSVSDYSRCCAPWRCCVLVYAG